MQRPWRCRFSARAGRVWPVCACALVILWIGYSVFAQTHAAAQFRVYSLKYKSARDVEKLLVEMLADSDSKTRIVADMRQNQLLVQGSERVQETARRLIDAFANDLGRLKVFEVLAEELRDLPAGERASLIPLLDHVEHRRRARRLLGL